MKVLIADDHALYRDGLRQLLIGMAPEPEIIESKSFQETLDALVRTGDVGLLLLDMRMPGMTGIASLRSLLQTAPSVPLIVISASEDPELIREALEAGAMGFVPKSESPRVMRHAIELVLGGGVYVPPVLLDLSGAGAESHGGDLTPRQREVLRLIIGGSSNKEIARDLGLSVATVKAHLSAIFRALEVTNRAQATAKVQRLGLLSASDPD